MSLMMNLRPLYDAIAMVESESGNVYQIRDIYIADVNRILSEKGDRITPRYTMSDKRSKAKSEWMMEVYWEYWGKEYFRKTGKPVTFEVLARIHNGGPCGYEKRATSGYWRKVKKVLIESGWKERK